LARLAAAIGRRVQLANCARALLTDANILALDEPTEGLDAETARQVPDGLRRTAERTLILLTHRPDGPAFMDEVVTFDGGKIVQCDQGRQSA
jgi:ATP-binding cassette, subfamily C, bacterial CydC